MHALAIDYMTTFSCPACCSQPHNKLTLIVDGKEMGIQRALMKPHQPPHAQDHVQAELLYGCCHIAFSFFLMQRLGYGSML